MRFWVVPASSTERKPEPRTSAGARNLMSWLLPSFAVQSCISRVSEWPLAAVMVMVMVATLVAGVSSAAMASVTSCAVWKRWAEAVARAALRQKARAATSAVRRARVGAAVGWGMSDLLGGG